MLQRATLTLTILLLTAPAGAEPTPQDAAQAATQETVEGTEQADTAETLYDFLRQSSDVEYGTSAEGQHATPGSPSEAAPEVHTSAAGNQFLSLPGADGAGVQGQHISVPSGHAAVGGSGESFSTQASTGVGSYSLPFALPVARGKAQPSLSLVYSSASGPGEGGLGWSLSGASISRQTDKGPPRYDDRESWHPAQDRFVFGGEELVPICDVETTETRGCSGAMPGEVMPSWSSGWMYFRARVEGSFQRFFWSPDRQTWRIQDKAGVLLELGVPLDGSARRDAVEAVPSDDRRIYRWNLARAFDAYHDASGAPVNVVQYRYEHRGGVALLRDIYDTPPANGNGDAPLSEYAHHTRLHWEERTDPRHGYRSGFLRSHSARLRRVDVTSMPFAVGSAARREVLRRTHLRYEDTYNASLLTEVQVEGRCEALDGTPPAQEQADGSLSDSDCPRLPPITFEYSHVNGFSASGEATSPPLAGFEAFDERVRDLAESPPHSLDEAQVAFFDVNADALPDVLVTDPAHYEGNHGVFFNSSGPGPRGFLPDTITVDGSLGVTSTDIRLGNLNLVSADLDGDAVTDLVHMPRPSSYNVYTPERRNGRWWWRPRRGGGALDARLDLGNDAPDLRTADVNFDGLMDVVRATGTGLQTFFGLGRYPGGDGQFGQAQWTGPVTAALTSTPYTTCLPHAGTSVSLRDADTLLADMNGDSLPDIVRARRGDIYYWPGRGDGRWGTEIGDAEEAACTGGGVRAGTEVRMTDSPFYSDFAGRSLLVDDVNADGLADLVQVRTNAVDIWLNRDGTGWSTKFELRGTPSSPGLASRVRLHDVDGSGTRDIVFGNAGRYQYLDLAGGTPPGLLIRVDNGLGKTTKLTYTSSTEEMRAAADRGKPWDTHLPMVSQLVKRITHSTGINVAGSPAVEHVTEYSYQDPYYDGLQREFRGFRSTQTREVGDSNSPTSVTTTHALLGECGSASAEDAQGTEEGCSAEDRWKDQSSEGLKGLVYLTEQASEAGVFLSSTHQSYQLRTLYLGLDGRAVRHAAPLDTTTNLYGTDAAGTPVTGAGTVCTSGAFCLPTIVLDASPVSGGTDTAEGDVVRRTLMPARRPLGMVQLRTKSSTDVFGNTLAVVQHGRVNGTNPDDVITEFSEPGRPDCDTTGWLWRSVRTGVRSSKSGDLEYQVRRYGYNCVGDQVRSHGLLAGTLELDRSLPDTDSAPARSDGVDAPEYIWLSSTAYDAFGNTRRTRGAGLRCTDLAYDDAYAQIVVEETAYREGCSNLDLATPGHGPLTTRVAAFDRGLGAVTAAEDASGQVTEQAYDGFGRVTATFAPHPSGTAVTPRLPKTRYRYFSPPESGSTYSLIHTVTQDGPNPTDSSVLESWTYVDGFGRTLVTLSQAESAEGSSAPRWVTGGRVTWDSKGAKERQYLPEFYEGDPRRFPVQGPPQSAYGRLHYDAFGRVLRSYDVDATVTVSNIYHASSVDTWDAADKEPGPHAGTPLTTHKDGHGRVVQTVERFHEDNKVVARVTETTYLPTGQPESITRRREPASGTVPVVRWYVYDSLGRMVLNAEPNTTSNFRVVENPNGNWDHQARYGALRDSATPLRAWRYRYNDAGDIVGTSDARGCGRNYFFDGFGRLVGEDYFGCEAHHAPYSAPTLDPVSKLPVNGSGLEARYEYDEYPTGLGGDCVLPSPTSAEGRFAQGRLVRVVDRGRDLVTRYDARGRPACVGTRVRKPESEGSGFADRWYTRQLRYDAADRLVHQTTGAAVPELTVDGQSAITTHYSKRGQMDQVDSSYGSLLLGVQRTADNLVSRFVYGDAARTETTWTYDDRRRIRNVLTARAPPPRGLWPSNWEASANTFPLILQDTELTYDVVGNPVEVRDYRIPEEWPEGAQPTSRSVLYDDLNRVKRVEYHAPGGADAWTSPFAAENAGTETTDTRRAVPSPHTDFEQRTTWQSFHYDWLGNHDQGQDDAHGFFDRSVGTANTGGAAAPYQLTDARSTDPKRGGALHATYDAAGYMTSLALQRNGPCLPAGASCDHVYAYQWDEAGRLSVARRFDLDVKDVKKPPSTAERAPDVELRYLYDAEDQRVVKSAVHHAAGGSAAGERDAERAERHTVYVFATLELRGALFDAAQGDYERNATTEVPYLIADNLQLGRVVYDAAPEAGICDPENLDTKDLRTEHCASLGKQRIFFHLTDHLGSTSALFDKATSEVVEHITYQVNGATESDYRPERWGHFRQDARFTGKEEDIEVGLTYFGKRYLNPYLGRWISADPLAVHAAEADLNLYAYVSGSALKNVDPLGLEERSPAEVAADRDREIGRLTNEVATLQNARADLEAADGAYNGTTKLDDGSVRLSDSEVEKRFGIRRGTLASERTGFQAAIYYNKARNHYTVAFAGTDPLSVADDATDAAQIFGVGTPGQHQMAIKVGSQVHREAGNASVSFTGHSLGGSLAITAALSTGRDANVFATLGVNVFTRATAAAAARGNGVQDRGRITGYRVFGDIAAKANSSVFVRVPGKEVTLLPPGLKTILIGKVTLGLKSHLLGTHREALTSHFFDTQQRLHALQWEARKAR